MAFSRETEQRLERLDRMSNGTLRYRDDIGCILELARTKGDRSPLETIAFRAKACWKLSGMMKRNGPGSTGYDALASQFAENDEAACAELKRLWDGSVDGRFRVFAERFFSGTPESLRARIELYHDLNWLKNEMIDHSTDTLS